MKTMTGLLRLTRPANMLICFMAVVCGGVLGGAPFSRFGMLVSSLLNGSSGDGHWEWHVLSAAVSASLILAAGNAFNDVRDIDTDRINAPHRPLPSGLTTPFAATMFAAILAGAGLFFSIPLGCAGTGLALGAVILLCVYDVKLKRVPLAGNAAVAFLGGAAFVYGGLAGDAVTRSFLPAGYAALFHLGRELIKDAADFEGDSAAGISTAATAWGVRTACLLSSLTLTALAAVVLIPPLTGMFGTVYTAVITAGNLPVIAYAVLIPLYDRSAPTLSRIAVILKIDMPVGLIAVLAGFQGM